jgi:hypothetical protein
VVGSLTLASSLAVASGAAHRSSATGFTARVERSAGRTSGIAIATDAGTVPPMPSTAPSSPLYSKVTDEFTLPLPPAQAMVLCREATEGAQWMHIKESDESRLLVKYIPVPLGKNAKIEVLLSDAGGAATTVTLRGWFFGMGKPQLRKAVRRLRAAIDEQTEQKGSSPRDPAPGS